VALCACTINVAPPPPPPDDDNSQLPAPDPTTYSGRAAVMRATVFAVDSMLSDTGPLTLEGGARDAALLSIDPGGPVSAVVSHAATVGIGDRSTASSFLAEVELDIGGHQISSRLIYARAAAICDGGNASAIGNSELALLSIDGQTVIVGTNPNQEFILRDLAGNQVGRVIINEQVISTTGEVASITVNALHLEIPNVADIVLGHAYADIDCHRDFQRGDFVTCGGQLTGTPSGERANVGIAAGMLNDTLQGHFVCIDQTQNLRVRATGITAYHVLVDASGTPTNARRIVGNAEINGVAGFTFEVDVTDNGEPGTNDTCSIRLSNGYNASGNLTGGNAQLHSHGNR
jgi:hypothetical protein